MRRHELSDEEWAVIAPLLPTNSRGIERVDDRPCGASEPDRPGATCQSVMVRARRSTIGSPVGAKQVSGCQSARNADPLSASNIHPPVGDQRLACLALAGVAEGRPSAGDECLRL